METVYSTLRPALEGPMTQAVTSKARTLGQDMVYWDDFLGDGDVDEHNHTVVSHRWLVIIIMIIIIIIIIIIAFIGAVRDFLQSPHFTANRLHVGSSGPGAIVCKSRVTHRALITCNMS